VVKGQRQVGKTYLIREFGRKHYKNYIEINFEEAPSACSIFAGDLVIDDLISQISILTKKSITPGETLIFLDEIQKCDRARTSLKFFADVKRFDVIASGSLLGLSLSHNSDEGVPVGYEDSAHQMYPMDFEEFL
jgi:predicted AAA+ superfamily ATPase